MVDEPEAVEDDVENDEGDVAQMIIADEGSDAGRRCLSASKVFCDPQSASTLVMNVDTNQLNNQIPFLSLSIVGISLTAPSSYSLLGLHKLQRKLQSCATGCMQDNARFCFDKRQTAWR